MCHFVVIPIYNSWLHTLHRYTLDTDTDDEIQNYIKARYLSASEAAWRIFGFNINQREPSVTCLPVHTLGQDYVVFRDDSDHADVSQGSSVSMLDRYFSRPEDTMFDELRYCKYYEDFMVSKSLPDKASESWRDQVPDHQMIKEKCLTHYMACLIKDGQIKSYFITG